jgi:hypothetical protein
VSEALRGFVTPFTHAGIVPGVSHDRFLPNPFQIHHSLSNHSKPNRPAIDGAAKRIHKKTISVYAKK